MYIHSTNYITRYKIFKLYDENSSFRFIIYIFNFPISYRNLYEKIYSKKYFLTKAEKIFSFDVAHKKFISPTGHQKSLVAQTNAEHV